MGEEKGGAQWEKRGRGSMGKEEGGAQWEKRGEGHNGRRGGRGLKMDIKGKWYRVRV